MKKKIMLTTFLLLSMVILLSTPAALADGGGHLWFYSQDPDTIPLPAPQPLPNPQDWDPKYVGSDTDPWISQSVVIQSSGWEHFSIWLACAQFESLGTKLVVSINDVAAGAIKTISINGQEIASWDTSGTPPGCLTPHGVFNSAEFYGCGEVNVGDLQSPPGSPYAIEIEVEIELLDGAPNDMKIHFDAYGYTSTGECMFSPYSHDLTFMIPELFTAILAVASFSAFALYAVTRRKVQVNP